jgi:hypothetical protein
MICLIPQIYGANGLANGALVNTGHAAHFEDQFLSSFTPLNAAIGSQLSTLPFASPASGFTFSFSGGVPTRTSESFGPILSERAETIGRHRLFLGASYQYFSFGSIGGTNLKKLPAVFKHEDTPICNDASETISNGECFGPGGEPVVGLGNHPDPTQPGNNCPAFPCGDVYEKEVIATSTRVDLKVHQITAVVSFGITDRIDVSVAIPVLDVRMAVRSNATIITNSVTPGDMNVFHYPHLFVGNCNPNLPQCINLSEIFVRQRAATGIGDLTFRVKGTLWKLERLGLAAATDFRVPTGAETDFLGSGTWGIRPFAVLSYRGRVAPHANIGYQWNGDSILAGDINVETNTSRTGHLPNQFFYTVGADAGLIKNLTVAVDFIEQRFFDARKLSGTTFQDQGDINGNKHTFADLRQSVGSYDTRDLAAGFKLNLARKLQITANAIFKLNDEGLRAKVVPLVGATYTF